MQEQQKDFGKCEECAEVGVEVMIIKFGKPTKCCAKCAAKIILLNDSIKKILTK